MYNFIFHNPTKLIFGKDTIGRIGSEIKQRGHKKILLMAGGGSIKKNGVYRQIVDSLEDSRIELVESWGIRPNPTLSKVREMIKKAEEEDVDALLAAGGGSVIDSGKSVAAGIYMDDIWQAYEGKESIKKAMPLFTVLTLSATASEMNPNAVLTNEKEEKKWNISNPAVFPEVSIIDPSVQNTLPWYQTVNGAIDAIAHMMEHYAMDGDSETALAMNESIIKSVIKMTDRLEKDQQDYQARANLAWAATLGLNKVTGAGQGGGDWGTHGIEHGISAVNPEVSHGAGLGVVLPAWILHCKEINLELYSRWSKNIWGEESIQEGVLALREKIKQWGNPVTIEDLGIEKSQIDEIADKVMESRLTGSAKELTKEDVVRILELATEEKVKEKVT